MIALHVFKEVLSKRLATAIALVTLASAVLGFVAYGLSINSYIKAQKDLGAAKTSAYYSVAPFLGENKTFHSYTRTDIDKHDDAHI